MWVLSSPKRGQIYIPCTGRQNPNHWPARELPHLFFFSLILLEYSWFAMLCYFPYPQCLEQGVSQSRCSQKPVLRRRISRSLQAKNPAACTISSQDVPAAPLHTLASPFLKSCGFYCLWCQPFNSIPASKKRHKWKESSNMGKLLLSNSVSSMIRCPTLLLCYL